MQGNIENLMAKIPELIAVYGIKIILAFAIYIIGRWLVKGLVHVLSKTMESRRVDPTIVSFVKNIAYYALSTLVIIAALGQIGVQTASFVAIIGAAGLAIGFALQGSLASFAAGVLLILFRPFKLGDFVDAGGSSGVIRDVSIFSTTMLTPDNKTVIISNSSIMGGNITNFSTQPRRRVDFVIGVAYDSDLEGVKNEFNRIAHSDERILVNEGITIALSELADSSLNFVFRIWTKTEDYWPVYFDTTEKIKRNFDEAGIEFPFPQMDVHLNNAAQEAA